MGSCSDPSAKSRPFIRTFVGYFPEYDSGSEEDGMTPEEAKIYNKQRLESDGFDVDETGTLMLGQIHPIPLYPDLDDETTQLCESLAKTAIDEYNKSEHRDIEGELEFDQLLMATQQLAAGFLFRLTFDAKNLAKGGKSYPYQAVVLRGIMDKVEVMSFRPKPSGSDKRWFWNDR